MSKTTEYRLEIEKEISELEQKNYDAEIKELVKEYEDKIRKEYEDKRKEELTKLNVKKECLLELEEIEKTDTEEEKEEEPVEEEKEEAQVEGNVLNAPPFTAVIN